MSCAAIAAAGLHLASWHADPGFNDFNPGGFVRADCEILYGQPQAGVFYNSEERPSAYGGLVFELDRDAPATVFALIGGATGYDFPLVPLVNAGVRLGPFDDDLPLALVIGYTPAIEGKSSHLVHFALEWRF